ncbi:hypothetical protein FY034_13175 [Trichlorobacter lovleyi]|uniref:hypothetical protein n=1 Tax=Trichlorobacter lovleyi TaxID=313985 RepID=UPI00224067FA|nr:hypothetical protein [Trichlorobacter lovleyi]QOX79843.1 hypothetical protein FY034_13175 [Trichlorobacter lovleyi]
MEEMNNNATNVRKVCTEAMVAEVVADLIAEGNVSRVNSMTPTIASISARIFERYDGLTPSASTLIRMRDKVMAERIPTSSDQINATPATLPSELVNVLDQYARQGQVMLGQLANALADVLQRTSDELAGKLRVAVEQTKQDASQTTAVAEEEVAAALAQNGQLREQVARLTAERDTAKAEATAERARATTFEQVNTTLLSGLAASGSSNHADEPALGAKPELPDEKPADPSFTELSPSGTPVAGERAAVKSSRRGRPRVTTPTIKQEAA